MQILQLGRYAQHLLINKRICGKRRHMIFRCRTIYVNIEILFRWYKNTADTLRPVLFRMEESSQHTLTFVQPIKL